MKKINTKYRGKCASCDCAIDAGDPCWYMPKADKGKRLKCVKCGEGVPAQAEPASDPAAAVLRGLRQVGHTRDGGRIVEAIKADRDGVHRMEWPSVEACVNNAVGDHATSEENLRDVRQCVESHQNDEFLGHRTTRELVELVHNPPAAEIAHIEKLKAELEGRIEYTAVRRSTLRNREFGDDLDSGAWVRRDPFGWTQNVKIPAAKSVVTIAVNTAVSAFESKANLLPRGACAIAISDFLESMGHATEIKIIDASRGPTSEVDIVVNTIVVKHSNMPTDVAGLSFCLCDPAFRRAFVLTGRMRLLPGTNYYGWGQPTSVPVGDAQGIDILLDRDVDSIESAERFMAKIVEKFSLEGVS